jgi:hypothetical protein
VVGGVDVGSSRVVEGLAQCLSSGRSCLFWRKPNIPLCMWRQGFQFQSCSTLSFLHHCITCITVCTFCYLFCAMQSMLFLVALFGSRLKGCQFCKLGAHAAICSFVSSCVFFVFSAVQCCTAAALVHGTASSVTVTVNRCYQLLFSPETPLLRVQRPTPELQGIEGSNQSV